MRDHNQTRRLQFDVKRNAWANTSSALNEERRKGAEAITQRKRDYQLLRKFNKKCKVLS